MPLNTVVSLNLVSPYLSPGLFSFQKVLSHCLSLKLQRIWGHSFGFFCVCRTLARGLTPSWTAVGRQHTSDRRLELTADLSDLGFRTQFLAFEHQAYGDPEVKAFLFLQLFSKTQKGKSLLQTVSLQRCNQHAYFAEMSRPLLSK